MHSLLWPFSSAFIRAHRRPPLAPLALLSLLLALVPASSARGADPPVSREAQVGVSSVGYLFFPIVGAAPRPTSQDARFGVDHVSYGSPDPAMAGNLATRYAQAVQAGAGWNRWVVYWSDVEKSLGYYDYTSVGQTIANDRANGLKTDAVLMSTPTFYATAGAFSAEAARPPRLGDSAWLRARLLGQSQMATADYNPYVTPPLNLYAPTFSDGTDTWQPGKKVNDGNPWARFVYETVSRFKGQVGVWEVWNEPDLSEFWHGSVADYVRLLKVAYLAAKSADPTAKVAVGGLAYWEWVQNHGGRPWLQDFLGELDKDPQRAANNYYVDAVPYHWYSRPSDIYWKTADARSTLAQHGIQGKEIWVNESNVPVCGEPPPSNPVPCDHNNWFANAQEQASFVVQAAAYAVAADVRQLFIFQHYDDGNAFAYGLHHNDGSARPAYVAYEVATRYLSGAVSATRAADAEYERITVNTVQGGVPRQAVVVWKRTPGDGGTWVPGSGTATLVDVSGARQSISAGGSGFWVPLGGATAYYSGSSDDYFVGGPPRILVSGSP